MDKKIEGVAFGSNNYVEKQRTPWSNSSVKKEYKVFRPP